MLYCVSIMFNKYSLSANYNKSVTNALDSTPFDISFSPNTNLIYLLIWSYKANKILTTYYCSKRILSLSSLYSSFIWYEREVLEFSPISIKGLSDSRNLLLPYKRSYNLIKKTSFLNTSTYSKQIIQSDRDCIYL